MERPLIRYTGRRQSSPELGYSSSSSAVALHARATRPVGHTWPASASTATELLCKSWRSGFRSLSAPLLLPPAISHASSSSTIVFIGSCNMHAEGIIWQLRRPRDGLARGPMGDCLNRDPAIPAVPADPWVPTAPPAPPALPPCRPRLPCRTGGLAVLAVPAAPAVPAV